MKSTNNKTTKVTVAALAAETPAALVAETPAALAAETPAAEIAAETRAILAAQLSATVSDVLNAIDVEVKRSAPPREGSWKRIEYDAAVITLEEEPNRWKTADDVLAFAAGARKLSPSAVRFGPAITEPFSIAASTGFGFGPVYWGNAYDASAAAASAMGYLEVYTWNAGERVPARIFNVISYGSFLSEVALPVSCGDDARAILGEGIRRAAHVYSLFANEYKTALDLIDLDRLVINDVNLVDTGHTTDITDYNRQQLYTRPIVYLASVCAMSAHQIITMI